MKSFAVFVLALILAPAAHAQHQTCTVNPDASEVKMTKGEAVVTPVSERCVSVDFPCEEGSIEQPTLPTPAGCALSAGKRSAMSSQ